MSIDKRMDCKSAEKLLVGYLYQELSPSDTVRIEKHLESCSPCTRTLENWRAIHRGFQRSVEEPPSAPYLKEKILASAREELTRKPSAFDRIFFILKPALVFPVMLFTALALFLVYNQQKEVAYAPLPQAAPVPQKAGESKAAEVRQEKAPEFAYAKKDSVDSSGGRSAEADKLEARDQKSLADSMEKNKLASVRSRDEYKAEAETAGKETDDTPASPTESYARQYDEEAPTPAAPEPALKVQPPAAQQPPPAESGSFEKAQSYFKRNDLGKGTSEAQQAIVQDKSRSLAAQFHQAGKEYQAKQEPEQAIVQFNLVLNNYPDYEESPDVLLRLAQSYEQIGAYDKAINAYRQLTQNAAMKEMATRKINEMRKKQDVQEQLRSLGYVDQQ